MFTAELKQEIRAEKNFYLMGLISKIYYQNLIKCMNEINNAIQKAIMQDCVSLKKDLFNKGTLILIYKCMIHRKQDCMFTERFIKIDSLYKKRFV